MVATKVLQAACEQVLQSVRGTQLNFEIRETPYSIFLTLRKSFTRNFQQQIQESSTADLTSIQKEKLDSSLKNLEYQLAALRTESESLSAENSRLSSSNTNIKISYEDEVSHSEELKYKIELLKSANENFQFKYIKKDLELNDLSLKNEHLLKDYYRTWRQPGLSMTSAHAEI